MPITAYVMGIGVIYDLLLSCHWMEGVGAQENYRTRKFTIDQGGIRKVVKATPAETLRRKEPPDQEIGSDQGLDLGANTQEDLEQEMADDAVEELQEEINGFVDRSEGNGWHH